MIKLDKVTKVYPDGTEAVKEVSFEVDEGELCVLLGPSGCGKTTTMKMINRLIPISGGIIYGLYILMGWTIPQWTRMSCAGI